MNQMRNDSSELNRKPTIEQVDKLAAELCQEFNNHSYFKWYCTAIWKLGIDRISEIRGRVSDAKMPGHLFTKYVNEELKKRDANETIKRMWNGEKD